MAKRTQENKTKFTVDDQASSKMARLGGAMAGLGGVFSRVVSAVNPLNLAIAGLGAALGGIKVVKIGQDFEQLQIGLAQTLKFMGQGGETFNDAMAQSAITIDRINAAAAALPGEAEDYAMAMQMAGANVQMATGDYERSFELIKNMTAVGATMGTQASVTASLINRMVNTQQGMLDMASDSSVAMLNAMKQLPGMANLTAMAFNKMDVDQRVKLMEAMVGQFDDMIESASGSMDSIKGATSTMMSMLTQKATLPLFEYMRKSLDAMNNAVLDSDGKFTELGSTILIVGKSVSESIVTAIQTSIKLAKDLYGWFSKLGESPVFQKLSSIISGAAGALSGIAATLGKAGASPAAPKAPAAGGDAANLSQLAALVGSGGPIAMAIAAGAKLAQASSVFFKLSQDGATLSSVWDNLSTLVAPVGDAFSGMMLSINGLTSMFAAGLGGLLPGLSEGIASLLGPVLETSKSFGKFAGEMYARTLPAATELGTSFGDLAAAIGRVGPAFTLLGKGATWISNIIADDLGPKFDLLVFMLTGFTNALTSAINHILDLIPGSAKLGAGGLEAGGGPPARGGSEATPYLYSATGLAETGGKGGKGGPGARGAPSARGGGKTVQDFRYSTFQIDQKFEEGFDPDRIAVAFAQDVGKLGTQKLQSGFEPAGAVG